MPYITLQEVREQAGFQYKVRGEAIGTGDGATVNFTLDNIPFVDRNRSGTPAGITDIAIYVAGIEVTVASATPASGLFTLASAPASGAITGDYDWSPTEDIVVELYLIEAHSLILSKIGEIYTLPLSETPAIVKLIEKRLAAGLILDKEYSVGGDETEDSRGRRWIKWAEQKLEDIVSGALELLDSSNVILTQRSGAVDGWPDSTTKDALESDSGGDINFRVKKDF